MGHPLTETVAAIVAAHRAGADDVDMPDLVAGACELLHLLAQEELALRLIDLLLHL